MLIMPTYFDFIGVNVLISIQKPFPRNSGSYFDNASKNKCDTALSAFFAYFVLKESDHSY